MDTAEVASLLEDLSGNIDDLESSLGPLLNTALSNTTSRAPLLDKAKLYVLATYAIESILFSYLRLNGVDAKEHAVFRELTRVKEYFEKIKLAEAGPAQRTSTLDKGAAARFVKQGLSGNDVYDRDRKTREQLSGKRKADELKQTTQWGSHNRFEGAAKRIRTQEEEMVPVVQAADVDDAADEGDRTGSTQPMSKADKKAAKRQRRLESKMAKQSPASNLSHAQDDDDEDYSDGDSHQQMPTHSAEGIYRDGVDTTKKKKKRKTRGEKRKELETERAHEMS